MAFKQGQLLTLLIGSTAIAAVVQYGESESANVQEECTSDTGGEMRGAKGPISREVTIRVANDALVSTLDPGDLVALSGTTDGSVAGVVTDSYIVKTRNRDVSTKGVIYQSYTLGIAQ